MADLTIAELQILLEALSHKYGLGYSENPEVGHLQAKLSIMQEAKIRVEEAQKKIRKV